MDPGTIVWGLLAALSAVSLAAGRPWTSKAAEHRTADAVRAHPLYREANMVITAGWTAYFAAAAGIEAVGPSWVTWPLLGAVPLLAKLSHTLGPKYAMRRLARGFDNGTTAGA